MAGESSAASIGATMASAGSGLLSNILTNVANKRSQKRTMDYNSAQAEVARQYNAAEAEKNRSFQQSMFAQEVNLQNTAYQRSMADMKKAGLNPILMFGSGGGAGTPSGMGGSQASGSGGSVGIQGYDVDLGKSVEGGVNTALALKRFELEQKQTEASVEKLNADTNKSQQEALLTGAMINTEMEKLHREHASAGQLNASASQLKSLEKINKQELEKMKVELKVKKAEAVSQIKKAEIDSKLTVVDALLGRFGKAGETVGKVLDWFKRW